MEQEESTVEQIVVTTHNDHVVIENTRMTVKTITKLINFKF